MNFEVMALIMRKAFGSPTKKQVVTMMAAHAEENEYFVWSATWLGAACEVHERTVRRTWRALVEMGVLKKHATVKRNGGDLIVWRLDLEAIRQLPDLSLGVEEIL